MRIEQVVNKADVDEVRDLFREYETWLGLDLCFQDFEAELAALPGKYAPPDGRLYLAYSDDRPAGCIAMRPLTDGICEVKRLYVRRQFRGLGIGKLLIEQLIVDAREIGHKTMRLDTYPSKMAKAVKLYEFDGFRPLEPYYNNPHEGVLFMELDLCQSPILRPAN